MTGQGQGPAIPGGLAIAEANRRREEERQRKRDADHRRFLARGRNQAQASDLLGLDVKRVPKAALAVVAVYLAAALTESADDFDAARARLWSEWETLRAQGIITAPKPRPRVARR